jgi:hypothetical protein
MLVAAPTPARIHAIEYKNSEHVTLLCRRFPNTVFADVNGIRECCLDCPVRLYLVFVNRISIVFSPSANGERPGQPLTSRESQSFLRR